MEILLKKKKSELVYKPNFVSTSLLEIPERLADGDHSSDPNFAAEIMQSTRPFNPLPTRREGNDAGHIKIGTA